MESVPPPERAPERLPERPIEPIVTPPKSSVVARHRMLAKLVCIAVLSGGLLVPLTLLSPVIDNRAAERDAAITEIQRDWGSEQTIVGPVLVLPTNDGKQVYALPDSLRITGELQPQMRSRGIYDAVVYVASLQLEGTFHRPLPEELGVAPDQIKWDRAYVAIMVSDLRGVGDVLKLRWGSQDVVLDPESLLGLWESSGLHAPVAVGSGTTAFALALTIRGSTGLRVAPLGMHDEVSLHGAWPNPSFVGAFLPTSRSLSDGFNASWQMSHYGRDYAQHGTGALPSEQLRASVFGVDLLPGIDGYRSVDRSIRYGALFIVLVIASFFLFEVSTRARIHPFQYTMIGLALAEFYLLLLALSELLPFAAAYAGASCGTIASIVLYMVPVLKTGARTAIAAALLAASFIVLYVILQAEDYALLAGSLVVFGVLATTMRLTRRIDWYGADDAAPPKPSAPMAPANTPDAV
jgi:inner membrane protein